MAEAEQAALSGTVIFSTIGRPFYGFDIFSVTIPSHLDDPSLLTLTELRLTDGVSVNYNGLILDEDGTLVFVSERSGGALCYVRRPGDPVVLQQLPSIPQSCFHDRPVVNNGRLYLVSNHQPSEHMPNCWAAIYSIDLDDDKSQFRRLTPYGAADFSPAVSESGKLVAVASYGFEPWDTNDYHDHKTDIVVFSASEPERRKLVCRLGGWPTWLGDATLFFHRKSSDGWWSVYRVDVPLQEDLMFTVDDVIESIRVTPPGVHAFTPSISSDGRRLAVATRRAGSEFRHVEIFDLETGSFHRVTEQLNPSMNHYNPFFSPGSGILGYHRFRGDAGPGELMVPHLEQVRSPLKELRLMRLNGDCGSFSPDGSLIAFNPDFDTGFDRNSGVRIVRSDGSKRWTVMKDRIAFSTAWSPTEPGVIYTSAGMIFDSVGSSVQIARIQFDPADLTEETEEVVSDVKFLTKAETGNNAFPSVSPDGKQVVFRSGRSGHKNLYIMDAKEGEWQEGGIRRLTEGPWIDTMPSWSPEGKYIAFSSNRHNPSDCESFSLYLVHPDGTGLRRVRVAAGSGADRERNNHVVFTADSEWIVFAGNMGGVSAESISMGHQFQPFGDIYACRLDGSELQRLTWTAYENGTPAWHPTGNAHMGPVVSKAPRDGDKLEGQFEEVKWLAPPVV